MGIQPPPRCRSRLCPTPFKTANEAPLLQRPTRMGRPGSRPPRRRVPPRGGDHRRPRPLHRRRRRSPPATLHGGHRRASGGGAALREVGGVGSEARAGVAAVTHKRLTITAEGLTKGRPRLIFVA